MKTNYLPLFAIVVAVAALAAGEAPQGRKAADAFFGLAPATLSWAQAPAGLPPGAQAVVLEGDPGKSGYFALRLKTPAGYKVMPHHHPGVERVTVIEGTFYLGMGEAWNDAALVAYPAGSYVSIPKGHRHFAHFKEPAVIQLASLGPWGITYVNPADDPRKPKP